MRFIICGNLTRLRNEIPFFSNTRKKWLCFNKNKNGGFSPLGFLTPWHFSSYVVGPGTVGARLRLGVMLAPKLMVSPWGGMGQRWPNEPGYKSYFASRALSRLAQRAGLQVLLKLFLQTRFCCLQGKRVFNSTSTHSARLAAPSPILVRHSSASLHPLHPQPAGKMT